MRFYHGTSVRGWIGILKSGSMDSKKMGDKRVSALYGKFKGNYLTTNRKIAEMYANKIGKGVVIEIEYDPLAPGRVNNFKEQQAAGKDYFVEETPLQVDGPDCFIDTKNPLMTKDKLRGDINKTTEGLHMSENIDRELRNAWQKLEEGAANDAVYMMISDALGEIIAEYPQYADQIKALEPQIMDSATQMGGEDIRVDYDYVYNRTKEALADFGVELNEMSAEDQLATLRVPSIDSDGRKIPGAIRVDNPQHRKMLRKPVASPPIETDRDPEDFYDDGIMESINYSLELLKKLKK
jgi:hypothetical protein